MVDADTLLEARVCVRSACQQWLAVTGEHAPLEPCVALMPAAAALFAGRSRPDRATLSRVARRYGYERDLLALLTQLARDMDRKIVRQKERAEQDNRPRALSADDREKLDALKARPAAPAPITVRAARAPSGSPWGRGPMRRPPPACPPCARPQRGLPGLGVCELCWSARSPFSS